MSALPFIFWIFSVVFGMIVYILVAKKIEASGLERLGATGHLFTCDPDKDKKK